MVDDDYMLEFLESAAPPPPSPDVALEALRPRIRRAHRRRAAMRGSAALVVMVVLGGLASQTISNQTSRDVRVRGTDSTAEIESTTIVAPPTTVSGLDDGGALPQTPGAMPAGGAAVHGAESGSSGRVGSSPQVGAAGAVPPAGAPAQNPAAARAPGARTSAAPKPATGAPAAGGTASGAQVTTFGSQGGTVEVTYTDTALSIESVSPLPGWSVGATAEVGGASVQVTFESESGEQAAVGVEVHLDGGVPVVGAVEDTVDETLEGAGDITGLVTGS
jgi:hypothetical protein